MSSPMTDPLEFVKSLWGSVNTPLPGFVPTVDAGELEKRIADLKAVEAWLQTNAQMLRMTIQSLEVQHATLAILGGATRAATGTAAPTGAGLPFGALDPAAWSAQMLAATSNLMGLGDAATEKPATTARKPRRKRSGA